MGGRKSDMRCRPGLNFYGAFTLLYIFLDLVSAVPVYAAFGHDMVQNGFIGRLDKDYDGYIEESEKPGGPRRDPDFRFI